MAKHVRLEETGKKMQDARPIVDNDPADNRTRYSGEDANDDRIPFILRMLRIYGFFIGIIFGMVVVHLMVYSF